MNARQISQERLQPPLLSVRQAAHRLGIGETTAYEWARRAELPGLVKLGGRLYVRAAILERFIRGDDAPDIPGAEPPTAARQRPTYGG